MFVLRLIGTKAVRWLPWSVFLVLTAPGCAGYGVWQAEVYQRLQAGDPQAALAMLEGRYYGGRNRVLHQLDKAMLLRLVGRYSESNRLFERAKQGMEALDAFSVTENVAAVTLNENARRYAGQPYERLLVHAYKALNYLELGKVDSARVEMLQADDQLREWASAGALQGIEASVFVRYLAGLVFEVNNEPGEALIAYRRAYQGLVHDGLPVPEVLQRDLLRLTDYQGLTDEHRRYRDSFSVERWPDMRRMQRNAEVILILHEGLVPPMRQKPVHLYSPVLSRNIVFSVPYYPPRETFAGPARVTVGNASAETAIMEDIDRLARERLQARLPGISARTMARIVAKKLAASEAGEEHLLAGVVVDIAGMASEQADTRSWTSLPATIQVARLLVPPGQRRIRVSGHTSDGRIWERSRTLRAGRKLVISLHEIAGRFTETAGDG